MVLAGQLGQLRDGVTLLEGSEVAVSRALAGLEPRDTLIAIDIRRYERSLVGLTRWARERGAAIIAVTDSPLSPLVAGAAETFFISAQGVGPFDSVTAGWPSPMCWSPAWPPGCARAPRPAWTPSRRPGPRWAPWSPNRGGGGAAGSLATNAPDRPEHRVTPPTRDGPAEAARLRHRPPSILGRRRRWLHGALRAVAGVAAVRQRPGSTTPVRGA